MKIHQTVLEFSDKFCKFLKLSEQTWEIYETKLNEAADHLILPVSHTGMLINPIVAEQTAYFLKHGEFKKA